MKERGRIRKIKANGIKNNMTGGGLWVFNPGHEEALLYAQRASYTPSLTVRRMMHQLTPLIQLLAQAGDYIYVPNLENKEAVLLDHLGQSVPEYDMPTKLHLKMWAYEKHLIKQVQVWAETKGLELICPNISPNYIKLSHRKSSSDFLNLLWEHYPNLIPTKELIPRWTNASIDELDTSLLHYLTSGYKHLVLKRPYTSSGRGIEAIDLPLPAHKYQILSKQIQTDGTFSLEPRWQKVQDYALLYYVGDKAVDFVGYSKFEVDAERGFAYSGNILLRDEEIEKELVQLFAKAEELSELKTFSLSYLSEHLVGQYEGYVGIDMMSYVDELGQLRLHPCVEINVRCTMGVLAHRLTHRLREGERAYFRISYCNEEQVDALRAQSDSICILNPKSVSSGFIAYVAYLR